MNNTELMDALKYDWTCVLTLHQNKWIRYDLYNYYTTKRWESAMYKTDLDKDLYEFEWIMQWLKINDYTRARFVDQFTALYCENKQ